MLTTAKAQKHPSPIERHSDFDEHYYNFLLELEGIMEEANNELQKEIRETYNKKSKHIVIYKDTIAIDSVSVIEQLHLNSENPIIKTQRYPNEKIFELMETEENSRKAK